MIAAEASAGEDVSRGERWRDAGALLGEACGLLTRGSVPALETSLRLVEQARRRLEAEPPAPGERVAAGEFTRMLPRAAKLARAAAAFYRECATLVLAGSLAYGPGGMAPPASKPARTLAEG